ncbi:MAG: TolC family protein [Gemmatimonadaceae bacterium]|nr:TolC family protein [Gemmatimonadaceae bacterium]NUQ92431.1 TolC family protein [Gemmatimonadaceae bacterium]
MRLQLLAALLLAAAPLGAQVRDSMQAGPALSLDDALTLARRNNTDLQQVQERRRTARAAQYAAYGALLPSADASFSGQYQQGGRQIYNGLQLGTNPNTLGSSYFIGLNYNINAGSLIAPRVAAANRDAVEADITGAQSTLRSSVTQQYLTALQARAKAELADTLVVAAQQQVELARARASVGSATSLDVQRAEVDLATQQVAALNAHNQVEIEKLRLFQQLGVEQPANVDLTTEFAITPVSFSIDSLLSMARQQNPQVVALREREHASVLSVRESRTAYTPSLSLSTGVGGYTQRYTDTDALISGARSSAAQSYEGCLANNFSRAGAGLATFPCGTGTLSPSQEAAIRSANDQYPFNFTKSPWSLRATVTLPIFNGFLREQRIEEAVASRNNARTLVRARELQLNAEVTGAYLTLATAQKTVAVQEQNAARARDELRLTEERYRVGAATFLDVVQARATYERAESDRINAVYDYHKAFAALEGAVGRPLR